MPATAGPLGPSGMRVRLEYDRTGLEVELPDRSRRPQPGLQGRRRHWPILAPPWPQVLAHPTGTPPLAELARGRHDACIVICDITRPVPNELILAAPAGHARSSPAFRATRSRSSSPPACTAPTKATSWSKWSAAKSPRAIASRTTTASELDEHTYLGDSPRGVPIWIDSRYVEADLKITTGLIEPHLMAGFSGGRKLICPGIAALETVKVWHGPDFLEHPKADCGILDGNPVHEENTWIARRAGCDFIVNVVIDGSGGR